MPTCALGAQRNSSRGVRLGSPGTSKLTVGAPRSGTVTVRENDLKAKSVFLGLIHVVDAWQQLNRTLKSGPAPQFWPTTEVTPLFSFVAGI